jgi:hypothetical protein
MASATNYISPYAPVAPEVLGLVPVLLPTQAAATTAPEVRDFVIEPSPDSTIEVLQPTQPECEPEPQPVAPNPPPKRRVGRPPKSAKVVVNSESTNAMNTPTKIEDTKVLGVTTRRKSKRAASPSPIPDTPPPRVKRAYRKRVSKVAATINDEGLGMEDEVQTLKNRIQTLEKEAQENARATETAATKAAEEAQAQRYIYATEMVSALTIDQMKEIILSKVMEDFPTMSLVPYLKEAEENQRARQKLEAPKQEKFIRTADWVNGSSDISMEDDIAGNFDDAEPSDDEDAHEASAYEDTKTTITPRRRRQPRTVPPRTMSSRQKKPAKKSLTPPPLPRAETPPSRHGLGLSAQAARGPQCVPVGILKKKPHNVVTAGFDSMGRLNWRVSKYDRAGNYVGCPNGPGTNREKTDLHPTLANLSPDAFRIEVDRRQRALEFGHGH